jgi:hypothetical protein
MKEKIGEEKPKMMPSKVSMPSWKNENQPEKIVNLQWEAIAASPAQVNDTYLRLCLTK